MIFKHKIVDDYYAEESTYPYPPKDIQLIILRYAANLSSETCKNIRLVRKCFSKDGIINDAMNRWLISFDKPLKLFQIKKEQYEKFSNMGYINKFWYIWDSIRRNKRYNEDINFMFNYEGKTYLNEGYYVHMSHVGLLDYSVKDGEIALLIKSKDTNYHDVLFFVYLDPEKNINYAYNYILTNWAFIDGNTNETLKYIEDNDDDAKKDNVILNFNNFEIKLINTYCENEAKKSVSIGKKYKGIVIYFGNLTCDTIWHKYGIKLDDKYPLPKRAYTDFKNAWYH